MVESLRLDKIKLLRDAIETCARKEELTVGEVEVGMAAYNRELESELVAEMALKQLRDTLIKDTAQNMKNETVKKSDKTTYIS